MIFAGVPVGYQNSVFEKLDKMQVIGPAFHSAPTDCRIAKHSYL